MNQKVVKKIRKTANLLTSRAFMECHKLPFKQRLIFAWRILKADPKWNRMA